MDIKNEKAVHIYQSNNFGNRRNVKGTLLYKGEYRDCYVMGLLKGIGLIRMMMICLI